MKHVWTVRGLCRLLPCKAGMAGMEVLTEALRLAIPFSTGLLVDSLAGNGKGISGVWFNAALLLSAEGALVMAGYYREVLAARAFAALGARLSAAYWEEAFGLEPDRFSRIPVGTWMGKLTCDAKTVCSALRQGFRAAVGFGMFWVGSVFLVAGKSAFGVVLLAVALLAGLAASAFFLPRVKKTAGNMRKSTYAMGDLLLGMVKMHPLLATHGALPRYLPPAAKAAARTARRESLFSVVAARNRVATDLAFWGIRGMVVLMFAGLAMRGRCTIGEMVAFLVLAGQLLRGVAGVVQIAPAIETGMEALQEIRRTVAHAEVPGGGAAGHEAIREECGALVRCENASFAHPGGKQACEGFSASFRRGDFCVFLGRNGTGKSTLAKLLLGVLKPTGGKITRRKIRLGWVPQDSLLCGESILDAIRLKDGAVPVERVWQSLRACALDKWVESLPRGIHSAISQETLSGGQLQLLSIARAIVRDPDLLVVDEITNNLDIVAKQRIHAVLRTLGKDRAVILVSHDMDSLELANRVFLVADGGRIEELPVGTPRGKVIELLAGHEETTGEADGPAKTGTGKVRL